MIVFGPLTGFICFFGIAGLLVGNLVAALVRRSRRPDRIGRWAACAWLLVVAGAGIGLAMAALAEPGGGGLGGSVALMFLWFGFTNAATGYVTIRSAAIHGEMQ